MLLLLESLQLKVAVLRVATEFDITDNTSQVKRF